MAINKYTDGRIYKVTRSDLHESATEKINKSNRKHKYGAIATVVDNIKFPTKKEARHYQILNQMLRAGLIKSFKMQVKYEIFPGYIDTKGKKIRSINYVSDFDITTLENEVHVCDSKGMETQMFKVKSKMFGYVYKKDIVMFKKDSDIHKLIIGGE